MLDLNNRRSPTAIFDPRGFDAAPQYRGPIAADGTVHNPSGSGAIARAPVPAYRGTGAGRAATERNAATRYGRSIGGQNSLRLASQVQSVANGNPFPGTGGGAGGGGTAGGIGAGGVSTGISSTISPEQLAQARMNMMRAAGVQLTPGQAGAIGSNYADVARGLLDADDTDLARWGAFQHHDLQSQMEQARANAGIGWLGAMGRQQELDINDFLGQGDLFGNQLALISSIFN